MLWSSPFSSPSDSGNSRRWQSRLFTSSGTWTVPADVGVIWIDGCSGGAGGGGGFASATSGGGGAGGSSSPGYVQHHLPVAPGETLTLTIGAGGAGGAVGGNAGVAGVTAVTGTISGLVIDCGSRGGFGTATTGAAGPIQGATTGEPQTTAGVNNAAQFLTTAGTVYPYTPRYAGMNSAVTQAGCGGGGPGYAGGASYCGARMNLGGVAAGGGTPTGSPGNGLGGGGSGGNGLYGTCGAGGNGGAAGANATGYGAGGGGGGGNAPGGNGSPGFIRIYCLSSYTL